MNMDRFKDDHAAVLQAIEELKKLTSGGIAENAESIAKTVVKMSSAVRLHLTAEDTFLYPTLAKATDPSVVQLSKRFQDEMGGIASAYVEFANQWNTGKKVETNPEQFRASANTIFKALHQRIQRENKELYPLAEKISAA